MKSCIKKIARGIRNVLYNVIPVFDDSKKEWFRKLTLLTALFVFIGSSAYLLDSLVMQPNRIKASTQTLREWYRQDTDTHPDDIPDDGTVVYPEGMNQAFRSLYRRNQDVRGWLTFKTTGDDLFGGAVDNPVVQAADNQYYLNRDFLRKTDKAGSLYFDYRNDLSAGGKNRNLIIYGHNLNSGLMFSRFNLLAKSNLDYARRLTTLTLDTLYEQRTYKVFAVMIVNANAKEEPVFNYIQTDFTDQEFTQFIEEIKKRSLYVFGDVDVTADDELLTLSTCSNKRETNLKDGRTVIVARRVRRLENPQVDTSKTQINENVLMPRQWYIATGKELPKAYQ